VNRVNSPKAFSDLLRMFRRGVNGATSGAGIALGALWSNKLRAGLTTLGIIIGVTTVIGILSIIHGLDSSVQNQMDLMGVRTFYVTHMPWTRHEEWYKYRNRKPISGWQYRRMRELLPSVDAISPIENERVKVEWGGEQLTDVMLTGTNSEYIQVGGREVEYGRFFSGSDVEYGRPEVVLGADVSRRLFGKSDPLLKSVILGGDKYTVIGILKPMGNFLGHNQDAMAIIPISCFDRSFGSERGLMVGVKVKEGLELEEAKEELRGAVRKVRNLRPMESDDFAINEQKMLDDIYRKMTGNLYLVFIGVSLISLVVGGIGIMNIMLVSVTERTREIGIRKALGARRRTVLLQFLIESLMLSSLGGCCGVALGFLVAYVVDAITPLPASPSLFAVFSGLCFSSLVGVAFGIYPAYRASRLDPIVALRYE
jgi:putative ABC transport system permease protein